MVLETRQERQKRLLPWLVAVSFFMESLDITILNTAVPTIASSLSVSPLSMKNALMGYALSLALFIPLSGWLADRFGTRKIFSAAIGVFCLGSLLCGLSTRLPLLVLARVLQGLGGAMMIPVGRLTLARTFPKKELVNAMTFAVIPGMIGHVIGPVAGGLIVTWFNWRVIFLLNLPIGLLGLWVVAKHLPDHYGEEDHPMDWLGFLLFGLGVLGLSYGLDMLGHPEEALLPPLPLIVASSLALAAYLWHGFTHSTPLLNPRLFQERSFRISVLGGFVSRLGTGGMAFLLPLYYQVGLGFSPIKSALFILPQSLAAISSKFLVSKTLARFGYRQVLVVNTFLIGLSQLGFSTIRADTPALLIVAQGILHGLLASLFFSSVNTLQYADIPDTAYSQGNTIGSVMQQLSLSFGVAIAILSSQLFLHFSPGSETSASVMAPVLQHTIQLMGCLTLLSSWFYRGLKEQDGNGLTERSARPAAATS